MTSVLLDTHAWAWSLSGDASLSNAAVSGIQQAESVFVSPISFFEIGQKVRIGKWPEMGPFVRSLPDLLVGQGGRLAALTPEICLSASMAEWTHRDPFDRMLAATAIYYNLPLISADVVFDSFPSQEGRISRIW